MSDSENVWSEDIDRWIAIVLIVVLVVGLLLNVVAQSYQYKVGYCNNIGFYLFFKFQKQLIIKCNCCWSLDHATV